LSSKSKNLGKKGRKALKKRAEKGKSIIAKRLKKVI